MRACILSCLIGFVVCLWSALIFAAQNVGGIGEFADSMIAPVGVLANFIDAAAIIIGIGCLFGAVLRYSQFRINPVAAPLSSVIVLLILGVVLLCLPLLNYAFGDSVAFLHK